MSLNLQRMHDNKGFTRAFHFSGGILLDVTGQSLSSVAKPIIQLTAVVTRTAENSSTSNVSTNTTSRVGCKFKEGNNVIIWIT